MLNFIPQKCNLNDVCVDVISHIKNHAEIKNIAINSLIPVNIEIFADVNMLKTIFRNLISNAVKFTNPGGEINLKIEQFENLKMENNFQIDEFSNFQIISVSDNGIGIPF